KISEKIPIDASSDWDFRQLAVNNVNPPFQRAADLGLVEPVFTVYMQRLGDLATGEYGGVYTYGGLDKENCGDVIAYENLTSATYWQFRIKGFRAGDLQINRRWEVISDTGTSFNGVPTAIADKYDVFNQVFIIDCNSTTTLTLLIGDKEYTIESENLIANIGNNQCIMTMFPMDMGSFGPQWILGDPFIRQVLQYP
ncbi:eukaryotic aspartyl protease, partial [Cooperia oncophora]